MRSPSACTCARSTPRSRARARTAGGRASRGHSRFLTGIWPADELPASTKKRAKLTAKDELDPADAELFEVLREWRAARAKEAAPVDEYAVRMAIYNDDGSLKV